VLAAALFAVRRFVILVVLLSHKDVEFPVALFDAKAFVAGGLTPGRHVHLDPFIVGNDLQHLANLHLLHLGRRLRNRHRAVQPHAVERSVSFHLSQFFFASFVPQWGQSVISLATGFPHPAHTVSLTPHAWHHGIFAA
jgi:hypothetical protein